MAPKLIATLTLLILAYLLSTGPMLRLEHKGVISQRFYIRYYLCPINGLEKIPVTGPLLRAYIIWWSPLHRVHLSGGIN